MCGAEHPNHWRPGGSNWWSANSGPWIRTNLGGMFQPSRKLPPFVPLICDRVYVCMFTHPYIYICMYRERERVLSYIYYLHINIYIYYVCQCKLLFTVDFGATTGLFMCYNVLGYVRGHVYCRLIYRCLLPCEGFYATRHLRPAIRIHGQKAYQGCALSLLIVDCPQSEGSLMASTHEDPKI